MSSQEMTRLPSRRSTAPFTTRPAKFVLWGGLLPLLAVLGLASCLPSREPLLPEPSATPLPPTATFTLTPVWFPATPTSTPPPLPTGVGTPTPAVQAEHGALRFSDDFTDPSQWDLVRESKGSAALGEQELTLAISQPRAYLSSLRRSTQLADFYLEITASPNLCQEEDEYGLLLRYTAASDFYRFSLTCGGQTRLDRLLNGRASSPQPLGWSGAIPHGAPSSSRLGVLARGRELSFFVDGEYQFTVRDPSLPSGGIGVFARSNGDGAVTINFSDLKVYNVK